MNYIKITDNDAKKNIDFINLLMEKIKNNIHVLLELNLSFEINCQYVTYYNLFNTGIKINTLEMKFIPVIKLYNNITTEENIYVEKELLCTSFDINNTNTIINDVFCNFEKIKLISTYNLKIK
jgi:hypothetical protein